MILNLTKTVNDEMFTQLCQAIDDCIQKETSLRIYLNSPGGSVDSMLAIIDLINECKDAVEVIGYGELMSAAFNLFFAIECKKKLLPHTRGMAHLPYTQFDVDSTGKISGDAAIASLKGLKDLKPLFMNMFKKLDFTKEELETITNGKDVYFDYKQMLDLLNGKRKLNSKRTGKTRGEDRGVSIIFETESNSNNKKRR